LIIVPTAVIYGAVTANWLVFKNGLLMTILLPLYALITVLVLPIFIITGFFQSMTPAYALAMIVIGVPVIVVGLKVASIFFPSYDPAAAEASEKHLKKQRETQRRRSQGTI